MQFQHRHLAAHPGRQAGSGARRCVQLNAIVNRFDLRNLAAGDAGEGPVRVRVPVRRARRSRCRRRSSSSTSCRRRRPRTCMAWANAWHGLGSMTSGSEDVQRGAGGDHRTLRRARDAAGAAERQRDQRRPHQRDRLRLQRHLGAARVRAVAGDRHAGACDDQADARPVVQLHGHGWRRSSTPTRRRSSPRRTTCPETFEGAPFLAGAVFNDFVHAVVRARASPTTRRGTSSRSTPATAATRSRRASASCRSRRASRAARPGCRAS